MAKKLYLGNSEIAKLEDVYTKAQADTLLLAKQDALVSGTNIKTINGNSLLGSGNVSLVTDYNDLSNKPIINVANGQEYVEGQYYKKSTNTSTNLALNDNLTKIEFDMEKYPNFSGLVDNTWVDYGDANVKYLAILEKQNGKLYVCALNWGEENGSIDANAIIITDTNILGGEDTNNYITIYTAYFNGNRKISGGWGLQGAISGISFDTATGVLTLDTSYELITMNYESTFKAFAFKQFGGNGDICKYIGGELKKLITNNELELDVDVTPQANSYNPITSGGVHNALQSKQNNLTDSMDTGTLHTAIGFNTNGQLVQGYVNDSAPRYRHDVKIELANNRGLVTLMIINDSANEFNTASSIDTYLNTYGYNSNSASQMVCSGAYYEDGAVRCLYCLKRGADRQFNASYVTSNGVQNVTFGYSSATITDKVQQL